MSRTIFSISLALVLLISCRTGTSAQTDQGLLDPEDFAAQIESLQEAGDAYVLLDIRTPEELQETGIIEGAEHMDYYAVDFKARLEGLSREQPVLVYCRSGGRSGQTGSLLKGLGFTEVYDLDGGITAWQASGMKTVRP